LGTTTPGAKQTSIRKAAVDAKRKVPDSLSALERERADLDQP
jgi:hypothetical protein